MCVSEGEFVCVCERGRVFVWMCVYVTKGREFVRVLCVKESVCFWVCVCVAVQNELIHR